MYAYCGNNPVRYHDPSGRYEQEYSDDFTTESGQSRVEQVEGEFDSGANETGSLNFEVGDNIANPKDINFMQSSIKTKLVNILYLEKQKRLEMAHYRLQIYQKYEYGKMKMVSYGHLTKEG